MSQWRMAILSYVTTAFNDVRWFCVCVWREEGSLVLLVRLSCGVEGGVPKLSARSAENPQIFDVLSGKKAARRS